MALEAGVRSQAAGLFGRCDMAGAAWNPFCGGYGMVDLDGGECAWDAAACSSTLLSQGLIHEVSISIPDDAAAADPLLQGECSGGRGKVNADGAAPVTAAASGRRKRRRTRAAKNWEEVESQRMTHIAVERNRRKQMNDYLATLRSLMPPSFSQRGDQASIVGGAINFVKELEQLLQSLEAHKRSSSRRQCTADLNDASPPPPFANFFTFPQYSMSAATVAPAAPPTTSDEGNVDASGSSKPSAVADVEVTMVESHASLRVLARRRPRQLLRLIVGLQAHRLTVLHLNVTSAGHMALYSLNLKK
ncbi:hypothetical protein BRADI_4g32650v3 [Brachypodium distachyon]|uniref:BHLH domain-containing protein n=1 Tax=Brachypodium distachyon TaxID=15368 RepID=A0A2K2CRV0_BRADI|nr:hypothetical protein BRADI_4g32650v3 [Brachypodium distachyon]